MRGGWERRRNGYRIVGALADGVNAGPRDVGYQIQQGDRDTDSNYTYFLDLTSKLYYGRTSAEAYRSGISGFLGGGRDTDRSLDCILSTLAAERTATGGVAPPPPKN
jgi:hypothetical protein